MLEIYLRLLLRLILGQPQAGRPDGLRVKSLDKYEYNIRIEKIQKLVEKRDYKAAAQVADTIDWRKTKNSRMLFVVSTIYEHNHRFADAKNVLSTLYENGLGGRRAVYRLAEISAREHNFEEADMFYREYEEMVPEDPSIYILKYEIMAEKKAPLADQIAVLEEYKKREFDERWGYELAKLYHRAGREEDCVRLCDDIILWFSVGTFVKRAAKLKALYRPLTPDQEEKVHNQEKYKAYVRKIAQECESQADKKIEEAQAQKKMQKEAVAEMAITRAEEYNSGEREEADVLLDSMETIPEDEEMEAVEMAAVNGGGYAGAAPVKMETDAVPAYIEHGEPEYGKDVRETMQTAFSPEPVFADGENDVEDTTVNQWEHEVAEVISNFNRELNADADAMAQQEKKASDMVQGLLYVSAPSADRGMEYATEALKELHKVKGEKASKVARITGTKLNLLGFENSLSKLNGADLVIVEAFELSTMTLTELLRLTQKAPLQNIVVFVDTAERIDRLDARAKDVMVEVLFRIEQEERARKEAYKIQIKPVMMPEKSLVEAKLMMEEKAREAAAKEPDLLDLDSQIPDPVVRPAVMEQPLSDFSKAVAADRNIPVQQPKMPEDTWDRMPSGGRAEIDPEQLKANLVSVAETMVYQDEEKAQAPVKPSQASRTVKSGELSVPAFVARIKANAEELDCVIEEIAGLAIYALADKYSEEGMPLNEDLARQVTEAAVIRADKRGLGNLFSSKYDKEGRLILKEAHFKM